MGGRMRALAELIMRGRAAAIAVAVIACAVPMMFWLSAAAVALVTLRRGWQDGLQIFIWALLPAGAWAWMGQPSALFCLVGTMAMACSLRRTASWPVALMALVPAGGLMALVISDYYAPQVAHAMEILRQLYGPNLETLFPEGANLSQEQILTLLETSFVRTASFIIAGGAVLALILARGWQAMLYNPGGFRTEFHRLRLTPMVTVVLLGPMASGHVQHQLGHRRDTASPADAITGCRYCADAWSRGAAWIWQGLAATVLCAAARILPCGCIASLP